MPVDRTLLLPDLCLEWMQAHDEWIEIEQVCAGVANPSKESVRRALDKLVEDGLAIKRVPRRRPGMRVTYRAFLVVDPGALLEQCWPAPIKRRR